jgi:hypothetical protein
VIERRAKAEKRATCAVSQVKQCTKVKSAEQWQIIRLSRYLSDFAAAAFGNWSLKEMATKLREVTSDR